MSHEMMGIRNMLLSVTKQIIEAHLCELLKVNLGLGFDVGPVVDLCASQTVRPLDATLTGSTLRNLTGLATHPADRVQPLSVSDREIVGTSRALVNPILLTIHAFVSENVFVRVPLSTRNLFSHTFASVTVTRP
jgi:hypothetical protein